MPRRATVAEEPHCRCPAHLPLRSALASKGRDRALAAGSLLRLASHSCKLCSFASWTTHSAMGHSPERTPVAARSTGASRRRSTSSSRPPTETPPALSLPRERWYPATDYAIANCYLPCLLYDDEWAESWTPKPSSASEPSTPVLGDSPSDPARAASPSPPLPPAPRRRGWAFWRHERPRGTNAPSGPQVEDEEPPPPSYLEAVSDASSRASVDGTSSASGEDRVQLRNPFLRSSEAEAEAAAIVHVSEEANERLRRQRVRRAGSAISTDSGYGSVLSRFRSRPSEGSDIASTASGPGEATHSKRFSLPGRQNSKSRSFHWFFSGPAHAVP